ncbi:MAG: hypothetical protein KDB00_10935 [Planctomycetales bacterium]|nr:hypothetical protein [Planctomycetales bacterium]
MSREPDTQSDEGVKCPYCGLVVTDLSEYGECVSYWGHQGDDPVELDCEGCDETFYVREEVERTWHSFKSNSSERRIR